jgi:hypothetical protein
LLNDFCSLNATSAAWCKLDNWLYNILAHWNSHSHSTLHHIKWSGLAAGMMGNVKIILAFLEKIW